MQARSGTQPSCASGRAPVWLVSPPRPATRHIQLGFNAFCVHARCMTPTVRLFTGFQIGLDLPQSFSSWSTVRIWHRLRLRQRDGLLIEAGGGWCSILIMFPSLNKAPILATGRLYGLFKFVVPFAQALLFFTCGNLCCASTRIACRGAAQVCLKVAPDGCTKA